MPWDIGLEVLSPERKKMEVLILVLVIIGALFAIASGVWVAIALINAISTSAKQKQQSPSGHNL